MQLLQELQDRGFKISVVSGNNLKVTPGSKLTPELTERLKTHKAELIQILSAELSHDYYRRYVEVIIAEFNSRGISITDVPKANRLKAGEIEKKMNEAANRGDMEEVRKFLKQWRRCFH